MERRGLVVGLRTRNPKVVGSIPGCGVVSLSKKLYLHVLLSTQVYKMGTSQKGQGVRLNRQPLDTPERFQERLGSYCKVG